MDTGSIVIALLIILVCGTPLLLVVAGLVRLTSSRKFTKRAAPASAVVLDMPARQELIPIGDGNQIATTLFEPIVRYQLPDGATVETRVEVPLHKRTLTVGEAVAILYDPRQPQRVRLASNDGRGEGRRIAISGCLVALLIPLILLLIGGIALVAFGG